MNILFTGAFEPLSEEKELLIQNGHTVFFHKNEREMPKSPEKYDAVVCNSLFFFNPIEPFVNLCKIQLTSAGLDRVPTEYISEHKIKLFTASGVYSKPMAEFAVSAVLYFCKQTRFFEENQKKHQWQKHRSLTELNGKNVCILGCGDVGQETARLFKAFGCHITGVNRTERKTDVFDEILPLEKLQSAATKSDVFISCIALTEQTRGIIGKDFFAFLKPNAVFVNISRGAIADETALTEWLKSGGKAALDVFFEEPLFENSPLWDMPNALLTPHNSFVGDGNRERLWKKIKENLL